MPQGLVTAEAQNRLQRYGRTSCRPTPARSRLATVLAQFQDPLTILLLIATLISWSPDLRAGYPLPYEAIMILAIVMLNGLLGLHAGKPRRARRGGAPGDGRADCSGCSGRSSPW